MCGIAVARRVTVCAAGLFAVVLLATSVRAAASGAGARSVVAPTAADTDRTAADRSGPCEFAAMAAPLTLLEAVRRAMCFNPKTRVAWGQIEVSAADVRKARESYLPDLNGTAKEVDSATRTQVDFDAVLDSNSTAHYPQGTISFSWLLLDFGQRRGRLDSARDLLAAARANFNLDLQEVLLQVASDYFDVQAAQASLDSATDVVDLTGSSVAAAGERVGKGVAPLSDELQARTAHAQAVINRVNASSDLETKRGALAIDMGMDPDLAMVIPTIPSIRAVSDFEGTVSSLIQAAKREHPGVAVAQRELEAAQADEEAARAGMRPSISLVGGLDRSNQPLTPSLGSPSIPGSVSDKWVGVEIQLPISDPLWKRGEIAEARAKVEAQEQALFAAQQQVADEVWKSYTAVEADTRNVLNSETLLDTARESLNAAQHRYRGGVGNILELLTAQEAYASASQQRIQALADWQIAKVALAASLGRLGLSTFELAP